MWNLGVNLSHNASICLMHYDKIILYIEEERLSGKKYDHEAFNSLELALKFCKKFDHIGICSLRRKERIENYKKILQKYSKNQIYDFVSDHHKCHAFSSFYNSGMDEALCFVFDEAGSRDEYKTEIESVYKASYKHEFETIFKHYTHNTPINPIFTDSRFDTNEQSVGSLFTILCNKLGYNSLDAGKIMGLSAYGKEVEILDNKNFFSFSHILKDPIESSKYKIEDLSFMIQKETQEHVRNIIYYFVEKYNIKNIVLSGGYFLNCVANSTYLRDDLNIYIEPISHDGGTSIGIAKHLWHQFGDKNVLDKQESVFYGVEYNISKKQNTNYEEIVDLLLSGNPVCIFQGRSEGGPRALGNRSILMDPRLKDGKDKLNHIKGREKYRPFAAVILEEYSHEWFDMKTLKNSPFMLYSLNCLQEKISLIPAVLHIDNTSRIQTVNQTQNPNLYKLIKMFYNKTGIPLLLNTSFNLGGYPLVETLDDAYNCMKNSKLEYLFLPETLTLKKFKNNVQTY